MKYKDLPTTVKDSVENEARKEGLKKFRVKSFYGAVSSIAVLQLFDYYLFHVFTIVGPFSLFFGWLFLVLLYQQIVMITQIRVYVSEHIKKRSIHENISLTNILKIIVGLLALILWLVWVFKYPAHSYSGINISILAFAFQILVLFIQLGNLKVEKSKTMFSGPLFTGKSKNHLLGIVIAIPLLFMLGFILRTSEGEVPLLWGFSMVPMTILFTSITALLVEN